jgi:hypothetical protein
VRHLADGAVQQRLLGAAQCRQLRELHLSQFRCGELPTCTCAWPRCHSS